LAGHAALTDRGRRAAVVRAFVQCIRRTSPLRRERSGSRAAESGGLATDERAPGRDQGAARAPAGPLEEPVAVSVAGSDVLEADRVDFAIEVGAVKVGEAMVVGHSGCLLFWCSMAAWW
jgi:hypothetical protein